MISLPEKKTNTSCSLCRNISVKLIVFTFIGLIIYVSFNMVLTFGRTSINVDMSLKMRSNVIDVLNSIVNLSAADTHNRTISMKSISVNENERKKNRHSVLLEFTENKLKSFKKKRTMYEKQNIVIEQGKNSAKNKHYTSSEFNSNQSDNVNSRKENSASNKTDGTENENYNSKNAEETGKTYFVNKYGNIGDTKTNVRQHFCSSCFKHDFNYVIQNEKICQLYSSNQTIELLILIMTTHKNVRARTSLRSTWLSYTKQNTGSVRYVFLLGEINMGRQKEEVVKENGIHHDIIKEDFVDSYMNLTYKTIMGFKWASTFCEHALFVMKTDDDMFVNIPNLLKVLKISKQDKIQTSIMGACNSKAKPIRSKKSKWFASEDSYPDKFYPGFCSGTGYVTSMQVVKEVYLISPSIPFFHLEDVYVSLCIKRLDFKLQTLPGFNAGRPKFDPCIYKGEKLITAHQLTPIMLEMIWGRQCVKKP